eukprot:TRINITY_DN2509_c0_g1_i18.p1 TRINITY_DN2509_c0_g1~~TRINITY_DN2509_c0_g1_i18.p1  ORF type:complete len:247 (-),score=50.97 TRINITY_DN2509_c0_g1_i18:512-1252(-)
MPKRSRTKNKKTAVKMKEEEEEEKEEYEVKVEEPGDFEKWRQQIIARNRAKLQSLGINTMLEEIAQAVGDEKKAKKQKKESQKKQKQIDEPSRKSSRLTTQKEERIQQEEDEQQKLGKFIIDGVCPKCFRVITKGHKTHLGTCRGPAPVKEKRVPTIKQLIDKEEQNKQKLKELELDGLVDINDEVALFIVIGSTGNYYKVRFFYQRNTHMLMSRSQMSETRLQTHQVDTCRFRSRRGHLQVETST